MTKSATAIGAITLFVLDVPISTTWYGNVFRAPLVFEDDVSAVYKFDNMLVNLLARTAAPGLIAPAEVANPGAGAQFQFTIWSDDVDAACADLQARGVTFLNGPANRAWGLRTACFPDPDGYIWEIAQELPT